MAVKKFKQLFEGKVKTNRLIFEGMDTKIDEKISQAEFRIALGKAVGRDKANAMIRAGAYIRNEGGGGIFNVAFHGAQFASHGTSSPFGIPSMVRTFIIFLKHQLFIYIGFKKPAALVDHVAEAEQFLKDVDKNINQMQPGLRKLDKQYKKRDCEKFLKVSKH